MAPWRSSPSGWSWAVALAGLIYAGWLVAQVIGADEGTPRMREVGAAIRQGAKAYLARQFRAIILLVFILTGLIWATTEGTKEVAIGRAAAFFAGAAFSWLVGFVGMSLAVRGNLRVAAAARTSYGGALQLGYRTGTITGMLTDGLGLLGGTLIFMMFGEHAYEVLLGFGFGGTLLALFMRVGGGIYTKAADVGADLVGKVEAGIPEDDPRNAATIADNVGDNVGDCAGMAADIFESYEVTIVAAMILGYASFGHKGVIFPLLVRAIGVLGSIISTYSGQGRAQQHQRRGAAFGPPRVRPGLDHQRRRLRLAGARLPALRQELLCRVSAGPRRRPAGCQRSSELKTELRGDQRRPPQGERVSDRATYRQGLQRVHREARREDLRERPAVLGEPRHRRARHAAGLDLPDRHHPGDRAEQGDELLHAHPVRAGEVAGQGVYDGPCHQHHPGAGGRVRVGGGGHGGHRGGDPALGLHLPGASPIFIAYGVAMCGIGMLTLTGNTISMDVFGPVADNANGIGEMGYDREEMGEENYKRARQILADLDAVGNTTKAETKGIAIGSAVIAAVSLFASFIAVLAVRSEDRIGDMTVAEYSDRGGQAVDRLSPGVHRRPDRRRGAVPVQLDADPRRGPGGVPDRQGVPRSSSATRRSGRGPRSPTTAAW